MSQDFVESIATGGFAGVLGTRLVSRETDKVVIKLPYQEIFGTGRIHGGVISALIDIAATAAFWSHPDVGENTRGTTVEFTVHFLRLTVGLDLYAEMSSLLAFAAAFCTVTLARAARDSVRASSMDMTTASGGGSFSMTLARGGSGDGVAASIRLGVDMIE